MTNTLIILASAIVTGSSIYTVVVRRRIERRLNKALANLITIVDAIS